MRIFFSMFYSQTTPKLPAGGGGGEVEEKSKGSMGVEGPWPKDKIAVNAYA